MAAYRKGHSCKMALLGLIDSKFPVDKKELVSISSTDTIKAFDFLSHSWTIKKLEANILLFHRNWLGWLLQVPCNCKQSHTWVMNVTNHHIKYVALYPLTAKSGEKVPDALQQYCHTYGYPKK